LPVLLFKLESFDLQAFKNAQNQMEDLKKNGSAQELKDFHYAVFTFILSDSTHKFIDLVKVIIINSNNNRLSIPVDLFYRIIPRTSNYSLVFFRKDFENKMRLWFCLEFTQSQMAKFMSKDQKELLLEIVSIEQFK
jgi:hypothetical protein